MKRMEDRIPGKEGPVAAAILTAFVLFALCAAGCSSNAPAAPATVITGEQSAFIAAAENCTSADATITDAVGTFRYTSSGTCVVTKMLVRLNASEMPEMKIMLEGKSMNCTYSRGSFDPRLVTSLVGGIEYCSGDLKDDISRLMLFT